MDQATRTNGETSGANIRRDDQPGVAAPHNVVGMALSVIEEELPCLDRSQWSNLVSELPLFPPDSHPPPTLFPLISPLLQQKLGLLSLGRGRGWPGTLTWLSPDLSYKVNERLRNSWRPEGLEEQFRGYRRFDQETVPLNPIGSN